MADSLLAYNDTAYNFSSALSSWKEINLVELQKTLDKQGLEIVENQKENVVGRKKLAEQTRDFKKMPEEEKGTALKALLRAYQTEIDALTRRSKGAETSFLNVYKLLAEAPDPFPLLDAAVEQTARASEARVLELEVARQKEEVARLKVKVAEGVASEKERKKLQDKVGKYEIKMEAEIQEKVAAKEAELHATYDERLRNYEEREKDLQRQVTVARSQLRELRTTNDSSQAKLFDHSQRQDQETVARLEETDLITQDLERANSRVAEVERRNEKLRAEIESVRSGNETTARVAVLDSQISDLQSEVTRLIGSLDSQKEASTKERSALSKKIDELVKEKEARISEITVLKERIKQFGDYDEIKRELQIMKYVEFGEMDLDEELEGSAADREEVRMPDPNADKANQDQGKPLENLLIAKNRKLQDELTGLRVAHEELLGAHSTIAADLAAAQARLEEQRSLNDRLENDLLRVNEGPSAGVSRVATPLRDDPLVGLNLGKKETNGVANSAPAPSAAEGSILPIITSQRDRFRQRNAELEEELRRQFQTMTGLRSEIKALQTDNLKLYEKIRYLQSYRDDTSGSRSGARGEEELGRYRNKYENSMDPFEAFQRKERGRMVQKLNPVEKVLLSLASVVLSNRISRNVFAFYALGLHAIVVSVLFSWSTESNSIENILSPGYAIPPI